MVLQSSRNVTGTLQKAMAAVQYCKGLARSDSARNCFATPLGYSCRGLHGHVDRAARRNVCSNAVYVAITLDDCPE